MKPHRIFLLRHGETEGNVARRFQGQLDTPLTERGVAQARKYGQVLISLLAEEPAFRIIASPQGRTLHTAKLICFELGLDTAVIESEPRLMEFHFGHWQGLTAEEIEIRDPEAWQARKAAMWHHQVPGGESYLQVAGRVGSWLAEAEGCLVVVSHGAAGRVLRGLYKGDIGPETLTLDAPQDGFFELVGGEILRH